MLITSPKREPFFWLVQLSVLWSFSLGFLEPCEDSKNGTTIVAEIGRPVSVFFCVETNETVHYDVGIIEPSHRGTWIVNTKDDTKGQNVVKNITLMNVTNQDLNVTFRVKILTSRKQHNGKSSLDKSIVFTFILQAEAPQIATTESFTTSKTKTTTGTRLTSLSATGTNPSQQNSKSDSSSEEMMKYIYIAVAALIVVMAVIIGVLVRRYRGRSMKPKSAYNDELNAYAEIKDSMISPVNECHRKVDNYADDTQIVYANGVTGDNSCGPLVAAGAQGEPSDGRNISEQGLVYATVAHATKNNRAKPEQAKPQEIRQKETNLEQTKKAHVVEQVEYTTINLDRSGKCSAPEEKVYKNQ